MALMKLSPPTLGGAMDAALKAAIEKIMPRNCSFEDFMAKDSHAPLGLKIRTLKSKSRATRSAQSKWASSPSGNGKRSSRRSSARACCRAIPRRSRATQASAKFGELTRKNWPSGLKSVGGGGQQDRYIYSTVSLFDLVEIKSTRYGVLTESPASLVLAARIDPRFAADAEYPNQWRSIDKDAPGQKVLGENHLVPWRRFSI